MKRNALLLALIIACLSVCWQTPGGQWKEEKHQGYILYFTDEDAERTKEYASLTDKGINAVTGFFGSSFRKDFDLCIHPNRKSLDSTWQKDWNMPEFKSECWMVASGMATRLDLISPVRWNQEACEHQYSEKEKTQNLITHELVHVFHGQLNASPDFSATEGLDWFVEGLATYASGQCDSSRIAEIRKAMLGNTVPQKLDDFWKGKLRYGLSGSVVMFIDKKYGREKLKTLLPMTKKTELLSALNTSEEILLKDWKEYILM